MGISRDILYFSIAINLKAFPHFHDHVLSTLQMVDLGKKELVCSLLRQMHKFTNEMQKII